MPIPKLNPAASIVLVALAVFALPSLASAQASLSSITEVEIDRDASTLRDEIRVRPKDIDVADTLLVFTNSGPVRARVGCVAYNRAGTPIGRAYLFAPPHGLKFMSASDLSNGADFIGQVACSTQQHVVPSAIFLGPTIENLNVRVVEHDYTTRIRIPLVATY